MTDKLPNYRSFHPIVADAYQSVHKWLQSQPKLQGYKQYIPYNKLKDKLTLKSAATQYYIYFPAHYFKIIYTLEDIIGSERIRNWIEYNRHICVIDIGCGAGAASAAFIETIVRQVEQQALTHTLDISCIGIDINQEALPIYKKLISQLRREVSDFNINVEWKIYPKGIQETIVSVIGYLNQKRQQWNNIPRLSHAIVFQSNVVSPLSDCFDKQKEEYQKLISLGIEPDEILDNHPEFGQGEAIAYKSLFEQSEIDYLHIITVDTGEKYLPSVQKMAKALDEQFKTNRHRVERLGEGSHKIYFENPQGGCFRDWGKKHFPPNDDENKEFHIDVSTITSAQLEQDKDWNDVISPENIRDAWAKTRRNFFTETLVDEVEIRLFEKDLEKNIYKLKEELKTYVTEVIRSDDYISYGIPKNQSQARPKGLSRMEEQILSVAIIKKLGEKTSALRGQSYAYRISNDRNGVTEYLYENWFNAYTNFINDARQWARQHPDGVVIRTDIKSFYTNIIQDQLIELAGNELTNSERVRALLRLLLSKELNSHDLGKGITQGNIESGFYANIYLTAIDTRFSNINEWGLKFFRYVDDMILVVPEAEDVPDILSVLRDELKHLELELNDQKTDKLSVEEFLDQTKNDELLEELSLRYEKIINAISIMNSDYRTEFKKAYRNDARIWWDLVNQYQKALECVGFYVEATDLSRKISRYLVNGKQQRIKDLNGDQELNLYLIDYSDNDSGLQEWCDYFKIHNQSWLKEKNDLRKEIIKLFKQSWSELQKISGRNYIEERKLQKRLRFAISKLKILGFKSIVNLLIEILCEDPWYIRDPLHILESLARQKNKQALIQIISSYENPDFPAFVHSEYMRAVTLRAIRFLENHFNVYLWEIMVRYATTGSIVERLMATETWLYLGYMSHRFTKPNHRDAVWQELHSDKEIINNRLKKNYILILGLDKTDFLSNDTELLNSDDSMLREAKRLALTGNISELFEDPEPKILRDKYYSGKRQPERGGESDVSPM